MRGTRKGIICPPDPPSQRRPTLSIIERRTTNKNAPLMTRKVVAMQSDLLDVKMDALISWAFDLPPLAAPCPHLIDGDAIQFGADDQRAW